MLRNYWDQFGFTFIIFDKICQPQIIDSFAKSNFFDCFANCIVGSKPYSNNSGDSNIKF